MCIETDLDVPDAGTSSREVYEWTWFVVDSIFNVVFLTEMVLLFNAERWDWPRSPWNLFDCALVLTGSIDTWFLPLISPQSDLS